MSETQTPPKLFVNKPKRGVHPRGLEKGDPAPKAAMQQPALAPAKAPFWYRYRAAVGALLLVNLGIGGYVLSRPKPKATILQKSAKTEPEPQPEKEQEAPEPAPAPVMASVIAAPAWVPPPKAVVSPEQQREVLQWVLQEKRKVKPQSKAEKARINEEKRYLKELIKGNELPTLS